MNLFSKSVSSGLRYLVQNEGCDQPFLTTAWFVDFCSRWFDIMSSSHPVMTLSNHNTEAYANAMTHLNLALGAFRNLKVGKGVEAYSNRHSVVHHVNYWPPR